MSDSKRRVTEMATERSKVDDNRIKVSALTQMEENLIASIRSEGMTVCMYTAAADGCGRTVPNTRQKSRGIQRRSRGLG